METDRIPIGKICEVKTGAPMSRAKKAVAGEEQAETKVLVPGAMSVGYIDDAQLATESVSRVKGDLFTREGDVIVKASTPYECVYVDGEHAGILVTSYSLILRPIKEGVIDARYLTAYLNYVRSQGALQAMSKGVGIQLIKRRDLASFPVLVPPIAKQERLAALFEGVQRNNALCRSVMKKTSLLLDGELSRLVLGDTN